MCYLKFSSYAPEKNEEYSRNIPKMLCVNLLISSCSLQLFSKLPNDITQELLASMPNPTASFKLQNPPSPGMGNDSDDSFVY